MDMTYQDDPANPSQAASRQLRQACSNCSLRELCLPVKVDREQLAVLDELVYTRRRIRKGDSLFRTSDPFQSLYAVRSGFFKTTVATPDGRSQVTGFMMAGEFLGMDGIATERHLCDAVALEDSEVCAMPFATVESVAWRLEPLARHLHRLLAQEIHRDSGVMLMLGSMRAEERIALFLQDLSRRHGARGYSSTEFVLRMTREEIGSYLGLKLETVSRCLSRLGELGLIEVNQKRIRIVDAAGLSAHVAAARMRV